MPKKLIRIDALVLFINLILLPFSFVFSYEDVKVEKIITLPDKKATPSVLQIDTEGRLWILNTTDRSLQRLSDQGLVSFNFPSGKKGLFKDPIDFDFFSDGSLAVIDEGVGKVIVVAGSKSEGAEPVSIDWSKNRITAQFPVTDPNSIAISRDDIIAVGYRNQAGVDLFSSDGVLLHRIFPPEKYAFKTITGLAFGGDGTLWVLDGDKGQLHRFSSERKWLSIIEALEGAEKVALDEYGYAYVTLNKGRWKEVSPSGAVTGTFGTKGKNPGEMLNPVGVAAPDEVHVWISESGNKRLQLYRLANKDKKTKLNPEPAAFVQVRLLSLWEDKADRALFNANGDILLCKDGKFEWTDAEGNVKSAWKKKTKGVPSVIDPSGFTIDSQGQIWVADQGDHTIKAVSESGEVLRSVGQKGSKEGSLKDPSLIRVRKDGSFVIVDKGGSRVQVLNPQGLFLFTAGASGRKEGQYSHVADVAVNDDMIVVLDDNRKALIFYSAAGKFLFEVANKEGKAPYWNEPVGLASDEDGRFYLLDKEAKRVRIFNRKGQFLADFTSQGNFITCGPTHKILVLGDKTAGLYTAHLVPRRVLNAEATDEGGDLKIDWETNPDATQFNVYRSSNSGPFSLAMKNVVPPVMDTKLTPSVLYSYAIAGVNEIGYEGAWSITKPVKASKRKDVSLINIEKTIFNPVFTAAFKYYVDKPFGEIQIKNNDEIVHRNIKIAMSLIRYTDFPTETVIPTIGAGELLTIPVALTFNDKVLELTENTPVQVDVKVSYFEDNQEKSVSLNAPVILYSRNAISWSDKARIASFITPRDTPIVEFARNAIRSFLVPLKGSTVGKPLAKAALFYESINALGITYVPDPKSPFSEVSGHPEMLDYVQFPRETLRRRTGDCDDMTSLLSSLMESVGVQTALVDMPGHILLMANLEESDPSIIGLPIERFVEFQGTYWVPIEVTQLGKNFLSAWQEGAAKVKSAQEKGSIEFIPVAQSFQSYPPVTLIEEDKETPAFPEEKVKQTFPAVLNQLQTERYEAKVRQIKEEIKTDPVNQMLQIQLGMIHVEGGKTDEAKKIFTDMMKEDVPVEVRAAAKNNMGNIAYLDADYEEAAKQYAAAAQLSAGDGGILVNQARTAWRLGEMKSAKNFLAEAKEKSKDWREFTTDIPAELLPN